MKTAWATVGIVLRKETLDALRDRRTLLMVFIASVLLGPLALIAVSSLVGSLEVSAEKREVYVAGLAYAPSLQNFFERQTYRVHLAPADYEAQLRSARFGDPVLVVAPDFEKALAQGEAPSVEIVSDSANQRSQAGTRRIERLLEAFSRERVILNLAFRGVAPQLLEPMRVDSRDLASTQTRAAQFTGMLPFFVMMAVLYGALHAALDTTAGERERGSLEPLLMNPSERWALVTGKWLAVAFVSMLIALLSSLSFLPAQWLLRSDSLAAMFQYDWPEVGLFLLILLPFAAALSALLMAVAIVCKSFKEAQASSAIVVLAVSMLPLVQLLNPGAQERWQLWVPALAQNLLLTRVLKGEALGAEQMLVPLAVCVVISVLGIGFVARSLRTAALR